MRRTRSRTPRPGILLTTRDRWIAAAVHEHRVLTTHQLAALAFGSVRGAQRRLTALTDLHLLERFRLPVLTGSTPAHYVLGPLGAALLSTTPEQPVRRDPIPAALTVPHTLGINDLYVALATAGRADATAPTERSGRLERWWGERTCGTWWGRHARPDAYGRWHGPDADGHLRTVDFFLEYDTGSENLPRVTAKLAGYRRLAETTGIITPVLFVLPTADREANLHQRLAGRSLEQTPVATTTPQALRRGPHPGGQVWLPVGARTTARTTVMLADLPEHLSGHESRSGGDGNPVRAGWTPPPPLPPR